LQKLQLPITGRHHVDRAFRIGRGWWSVDWLLV